MMLTSTPIPSEHPVRFYKIIALSFLCITLLLLGAIIFMSSRRAMITIITKSEPLEVSSMVTIDARDSDGQVKGIVTSTVVTLEKMFFPTGTRTEDAQAVGVVTLYNETNAAQALIPTTRLLSAEGVLFRMKDRATVPANGSVDVEVYADLPGATGNIMPTSFTIPGLREDRQSVIYGKSTADMMGGVRTIGVVGEEDVRKAEEVLREELKTLGARVLSEKVGAEMSGLFDIDPVIYGEVSERGLEADSFMLTGTTTVVGVWYDDAELHRYAVDMLEKRVVDNSQVLYSIELEPTISLDSYDLDMHTARILVAHRGLVNIDQNSQELQKAAFFGKSEDEVKRYVMSLKHVEGVEIVFRPVWGRSVPYVAENIEIIVREVQ